MTLCCLIATTSCSVAAMSCFVATLTCSVAATSCWVATSRRPVTATQTAILTLRSAVVLSRPFFAWLRFQRVVEPKSDPPEMFSPDLASHSTVCWQIIMRTLLCSGALVRSCTCAGMRSALSAPATSLPGCPWRRAACSRVLLRCGAKLPAPQPLLRFRAVGWHRNVASRPPFQHLDALDSCNLPSRVGPSPVPLAVPPSVATPI